MVTGISVNGNVLTCEGVDDCKTEAYSNERVFGARYCHPLCPEFPYYEVKITVAFYACYQFPAMRRLVVFWKAMLTHGT